MVACLHIFGIHTVCGPQALVGVDLVDGMKVGTEAAFARAHICPLVYVSSTTLSGFTQSLKSSLLCLPVSQGVSHSVLIV